MAFAIIGLLSLSFVAVDIFASEPRARSISVFRVDGYNAWLARGSRGGRETMPRDGQRLSGGNVLRTGHDTQINLALDAESIMRMDVSSRVQVGSAGVFRRRLSLTVSLGSVLVNVAEQDEGLTTDIVVGNTAFSIRGTMFTMGMTEDGGAQIVMLSGEGVVEMPGADGERVYVPLAAREVMIVYESAGPGQPPLSYEIYDMAIGDLPLFTLMEIVYNYEYLLEKGTVDEYMLVEASHLIPILIEQREQDRAFWDRFEEMLLRDNPPDITIFPFDEYEFIDPAQYEEEDGYVPERDSDVDGDALTRDLRANEEIAPITITWNPNGGSVSPSSSTIPPGSLYSSPVPTRSGFIFVGWFDTNAPTGGIQLSQPFAAPFGNATFWARWAEEPAEMITVTWHPNGGSFPGEGLNVAWEWELTAGLGYIREPYSLMPERSGFIFEGWFTTNAATGGNRVTTGFPMPSVNTTFWARWSPEPVGTVTITWNANGGSVWPGSSVFTPGTTLCHSDAPIATRSGYVFQSWWDTSAPTGGNMVCGFVVPSSNATFWARWSPAAQVRIMWNHNWPAGYIGSSEPPPSETFAVSGSQFGHVPAPLWVPTGGFVFVGWFDTSAPTGGTQITSTSTVPNANTNYWARWRQDFTPVTHISGVPPSFSAGSQTFTVQIHPGNATNAHMGIIWSVIDCGGTGAVVSGATFSTHSPGVMHVRATIPGGLGVGIDFHQDFWIVVD